jgi:hypothetical protein
MELDLSRYLWMLAALVFLMLLSSLGWLGYAYLPAGDHLLTRTEWQVLKARSTYRKELQELQFSVETLAELLNTLPDPVRTQLAVERIQRLTSQGHPALLYQREKVALAARSVSDWAVGALDREAALQALRESTEALLPQDPLPSPDNRLLQVFMPVISR